MLIKTDCAVLRVLMWKHMKERRHRICQTFVVSSGLLAFFVLFTVRRAFYAGKVENKLIDSNEVKSILFYPNNNLTQKLIGRVGDICRRSTTPKILGADGMIFWGFSNKYDVIQYLETNEYAEPIAIIGFENFDGRKIPSNFKYSVQIKGIKRSKKNIFPRVIIDDSLVDITTARLIGLHRVIDRAYTEEVTGHDIVHEEDIKFLEHPPGEDSRHLEFLLIVCGLIAPLPLYLCNASRFVDEKRSGLKELMKMLGVSSNVSRFSRLLETLILSIVYASAITMFLEVTNHPVLQYSNGLLIAFGIILSFLNMTALSFVTSALSQDYQHANGISLLVVMLSYQLNTLWYSYKAHKTVLVYFICWMLPHAPIYLFWHEVVFLEESGEGLQFYNMAALSTASSISVLFIWFFDVVQLVVMMILSWYLDLVRPGRYGVAQKWNFMFRKKYWTVKKKKVTFHVTAERNVRVLRDARHFERGPKKVEVAVKLAQVTKIYTGLGHARVVALDSVNFDVYKGEICMVVGNNGAGKSTLLSIITGMQSTTEGTVYVNGLDNSERIQEIRKDIGFCPQESLTFDFLTVIENISFFAKLRGNKSDRSSAQHLMTQLNLNDKANYYSHELSMGMQRSLQVACAMAGGTELLVLDEPTSGMDADTRRALWALLLQLRGKSTIIMATTFIEEADAIGDRIALLGTGRLRCYGTPSFLKNAFVTGFDLGITIKDNQDIVSIQEVVQEMIPDSTIKITEENRIKFVLPFKDKDLFAKLFDTLEEKRTELGIVEIESGTSMDEIFVEFLYTEEEDDKMFVAPSSYDFQEIRLKGHKLYLQQFLLQLKRNIIFIWSKKLQFIILQVIVPIIGLMIVTLNSNSSEYLPPDILNEKLSFVKDTILLNPGFTRRAALFESLRKSVPNGTDIVESKNVFKDILKSSITHKNKNKDGIRLSGIDINPNKTTFYCPVDDPSLALNTVNSFSNIYLTIHGLAATNANDNTISYTPLYLRTNPMLVEVKEHFHCINWSLWVAFLSIMTLAPFIWIPIKEFNLGTRHVHFIAGCPLMLIWSVKLLTHMVVYVTIVPTFVIIFAASLDNDDTINQTDFLAFFYCGCIIFGVVQNIVTFPGFLHDAIFIWLCSGGFKFLYVLLFLFGLAFLMHIYVLSYWLSEEHATSQIYVMSVLLAIVAPPFYYVVYYISDNWISWIEIPGTIIIYIMYVSPIFTFASGLDWISMVARFNALCRLNKNQCPQLHIYENFFNVSKCCESTSRTPFGYYDSIHSGLVEINLLIAQFIVNFILLINLQNRVLFNFLNQIAKWCYEAPLPNFNNIQVDQEKEKVARKMENLKKHNIVAQEGLLDDVAPDVLLAKDIHKRYVADICRMHEEIAVKGISFSVKEGECLGILGPNGAGKTTTLLMLAGYTVMTKGDSCINGHFIRKHRKKYLQSIGLVMSSCSLDEFMTGFENLKLLLVLQGRSLQAASRIAMYYLHYMGLASYANSLLGTYSVGCMRRLAMCEALVLSPIVALLDEPAANVDPSNRSLITRAIRHLRKIGTAIVVTENSMAWRHMEYVCNKIAIMSGGELAALGTVTEMRALLATGYTVRVRLKVYTVHVARRLPSTTVDDDSSSDATSIQDKDAQYRKEAKTVKNAFKELLPTSDLMDEILGRLKYHVKEREEQKLRYSEIFNKLESLKSRFPEFVEEYTVTEISIEEVLYRFKTI